MTTSSTIEIPQVILEAARMTSDAARRELAIALYAQGRLSLGKARELAGMALWELRQVLATRRIAPHYDMAALAEDVATLRALGRL